MSKKFTISFIQKMMIIVVLSTSAQAQVTQSSGKTAETAVSTNKTLNNELFLAGTVESLQLKEHWIVKHVPESFREKTFGVLRWQWFGVFLAIFLGLILKTIAKVIVRAAKKIVLRSKVVWDDHLLEDVEKPVSLITVSSFWYITIKVLMLDGFILSFLLFINQAIFSFSAIWLAYRVANNVSNYFKLLASRENSALDPQLVPLLAKAMRASVVVFGVLIALQNFGVNVMSLMAGLGLGGLAFALAAKDTAANLFGSIMILWDRPFVVGDWVKIGDSEGTVEEVGFRSTRVRTFYDSQISVPNSQMANVGIDNLGRRLYRRSRQILGVTYDTSPEKMELFLEGIKNIIKASAVTRKDYFHVVFSGYGNSSLEIMLYYFLRVDNWSEELVAKQNINLEILRLAKELEVDFAFPTQTLHVESFPEKTPLRSVPEIDLEKAQSVSKEFGPGGNRAKPSGLGLFTPPYI